MASANPIIGNRFQIQERIGAGAMGEVYRGTDLQTGQLVAIKQLKEEAVANDPAALERFHREAEALRQLNHPNIVKILDTVEENDQYYIVLEYVGGGSLADIINTQTRLPIIRTLHIALELADGLSRAHHLKIIHRDIKPANVMLADDGTPRLTDFGVAHLGNANRMTLTGITVGTPHYLAPEAMDATGVDFRADIWSFGVMLFEALTGQRPFTGRSLIEILTAIIMQPVPDLEMLRPELPTALIDLIYRMLEKDPQARLPSVRLIGAELESILDVLENAHAPVTRPNVVHKLDKRTSTTNTAIQAPHNLPAQMTPFVGRDTELAELRALWSDPAIRLVTILGPGGAGKTRLALETARLQATNFAHGVYFVSFASVSSPEGIIPAVAETLKFPFYGNGTPAQQLLAYLRDKELLLVLDNFEHLLEGVGIILEILQAAEGVHILVTSQQRLNLSVETIYALGGLDYPQDGSAVSALDASQYSAIKLFTQSVRRVRPALDLRDDDLKQVIAICRMVDGIPLGILLAAAWAEILSIKEIAAEISHNIEVLETIQRDLPERQRSIRAVFDYSWNLLNDVERAGFRDISVFRGSFTREAAEQVTGATLRCLATLTNKSLIRRHLDGRYEVHEVLRHFGLEKLQNSAESEVIPKAHCTYYADFLARREADLRGRRQSGGLSEIDKEFENIRTAWERAATYKQYDVIEHMISPLFLFCVMRTRRQEAAELFRLGRDRLAPESGSDPHPIWGALVTHYLAVSNETDLAACEQSLAIAQKYGNRAQEAFAQLAMGITHVQLKNYGACLGCYEQALSIFQETFDEYFMAITLRYTALCYAQMRQYGRMIAYNDQALALSQKIGHQIGIGLSYNTTAFTELFIGAYADAERHTRDAIKIMRETGDRWGLVLCTSTLGLITLLNGEIDQTQAHMEEVKQMAIDLSFTDYEAVASVALGIIAVWRGNIPSAQTSYEENHTRILPELGAEFQWLLAVLACELQDFSGAQTAIQAGLQAPNMKRGPALLIWYLPVAAAVRIYRADKTDDTVDREKAAKWLALAYRHPASATGWLDKSHYFSHVRADLQKLTVAWEQGKRLGLDEAEKEIRQYIESIAAIR